MRMFIKNLMICFFFKLGTGHQPTVQSNQNHLLVAQQSNHNFATSSCNKEGHIHPEVTGHSLEFCELDFVVYISYAS